MVYTALHFSFVWMSEKQYKVFLESISSVDKEMGSMPGSSGMNNGKNFKYNVYSLVLIGIQLQGIVGLTGLQWVVSLMTGIQ